jgi:hypothetical protein
MNAGGDVVVDFSTGAGFLLCPFVELQDLPVQGTSVPKCFRKVRKDKIKPAMSAYDPKRTLPKR